MQESSNLTDTRRTVGVIPARWASTRFPGKPLCVIAGKTMLQHVWDAAQRARLLDDLFVATDDDRIADLVHSFDGRVIHTGDHALASGTDRMHYALSISGTVYTHAVNIQGDEPLLHPNLIDDVVGAILQGDCDVATAIQACGSIKELTNSNIVKVVIGKNSNALYFSRALIPFVRTDAETLSNERIRTYWKHIGIYAYTRKALQRFVDLPESELEQAEKLEQLRLLEDGARYRCVPVPYKLFAVDTPSDAEIVESILSGDSSIPM